MSGKAGPTERTEGTPVRRPALIEGPLVVLSWLTIFPVQGTDHFDRTTGARAMASLPFAGLVLGILPAIFAAGLSALGVSPLLIAGLVVTSVQLLSRMMHIDGLADVGDALGAYVDESRAREILADKYTGALGMGAVVLALLIQVAGLSAVVGGLSPVLAGIATLLVIVLSRLGGMIGCSTAFRAFSASGFGALIIGTVKWRWLLTWVVAMILASGGIAWGVDTRLGLGLVLTLGVQLCVLGLFARHCTRRFGGLNGDCIGAQIEIGFALAAALLAITLSF